MSIVIVSLQLKMYKIICIMVNITIYILDIISINTYSLDEIISINYIKLKENIINLLTNVLSKEMCII
jgi:hypothetical protein